MPQRWSRRRLLAVAGSALLAGCSTGTPDTTGTPRQPAGGPTTGDPVPNPSGTSTSREWDAPTDPPATDVTTNVLVENLEIPWDISVAPNGDLFVTERVGRVNRFAAGDIERVLAPEAAIDAGTATPGYEDPPWWVRGGEGGTLGVAVHPGYPDEPYLYVYYTARAESIPGLTTTAESGKVNRVSRFDVSADDPDATEEVLVDRIPASNIHNGGRIAFGPDGVLWVTTGEAGRPKASGDPSWLGGKVLRVNADGTPADDNPDFGANADPHVYTTGHRNPQGLVWLPDGTPVVDEHGPNGRDEINRLAPGDDYGWPDVRKRDEYGSAPDVHPPLANTGASSWAPTGSVFYTGSTVESWQNRMIIGGLVSQQILVATLTPAGDELPPVTGNGTRFDAPLYDDAYTATVTPVLRDQLGRVRHVEQGLDGSLYAITSNRDGRADPPFPRANDDVLVEIVPA